MTIPKEKGKDTWQFLPQLLYGQRPTMMKAIIHEPSDGDFAISVRQ